MQKLSPQQRKVFRAYDIRGSVQILTADLIRQIAQAFAEMYHEQKQQVIVIGHDARLSSSDYAKIIAEVLYQTGLHIIEIGCVSSPLLYFTACQYQGNGMMITASHNPIQDNGIKWLVKGLAPTPEQILNIAQRIEILETQAVQQPKGQIVPQSEQSIIQYVEYLQKDIVLKSSPEPIKIAIDALNGSAGLIAQSALQKLGCEIFALNLEPNGHFPLGSPDPSNQDRLIALQNLVKNQKTMLGMALDGDGDRVVLIDEKGSIVNPDRLLCLLAKICLTQDLPSTAQPVVLCDVKCSTLFAKTANKYGGICRMIRTGSSFLRNELKASGACFGGEFAGHYVFSDGRGLGFDDGLYVALRVIEYLNQHDLTLSQALQEFPQHLATEDLYIENQDIDFDQVMSFLKQIIQQYPHLRCCEIDGIRIDFPHGFGLLRESNTGEYFTVRFDAEHQQALDDIQQFFIQHLQGDFAILAQRIQQKIAYSFTK